MANGPQHERFSAWFERRGRPRDAEARAELLAVADAYDAAMESGMLTAEQLQRVVDGASDSRALLWNNATDLLMKLSGKWPAAADAIAAMFQSRKAHVRFAALCSLGRETPASVTCEVLQAALHDKSPRVRWKAVDQANTLERRDLVPEITAALAVESDDEARCSMELSLRMLRDGYWLRPKSPGWTTVTVRLNNGIVSKTISDDELRTKGLEAILAEFRR